MPGCSPVVFNNVDANAWNCLKQKAIAYAQQHNYQFGPNVPDSGQEAAMGFTATWAFDPNAQTLTITCTGHPFFFSCATINGEIQKGIASTNCIPA